MKILFDLTPFELEGREFHGGSEYAYSALLYFLRNPSKYTLILFSFKMNADRPRVQLLCEKHKLKMISADEIRRFAKGNSVIFSALPSPNINTISNLASTILVCHGLRSIECPGNKSEILLLSSVRDIIKYVAKIMLRRVYIRRQVRKFKTIFPIDLDNINIIFPSMWSRASFKAHIGEARERMHVVPPPITELTLLGLDRYETRQEHNLIRDKVLFLSSDRWIKNVIPYLIFLSKKRRYLGELKIYYTGNLPLIARCLLKGKDIKELKNVEIHTLSDILKSTKFLVYPSLNEGFGYPVIEGIAHGATVFSTGVSALGEHTYNQLKFFSDKSDLLIKLVGEGYAKPCENDRSRIKDINNEFENGLCEIICKVSSLKN